MTERRNGSNFALGFLELLFLISVTVLFPLLLDYSVAKWYLAPVLGWNFARAFVASSMFEGVVFVVVGYYFVQERIEKHSYHYIEDLLIPDMLRLGFFKVINRARFKLGIALVVAGIILFFAGMFIIPAYYPI
jgi:hypothetical protein